MWTVLYVMLVVAEFDHTEQEGSVYILQRYETLAECEHERDRIGYAMADAYPYERDFIIVCRLTPTGHLT